MSINISPVHVDNKSATDLFCSLLTSAVDLGIEPDGEFVTGFEVSYLCTQILAYALCDNAKISGQTKIIAATLKKESPSEPGRVPDRKGMLVGFGAVSLIDGVAQIKYLSVLERYRGKKIASKIIRKAVPNGYPTIAGINNSLIPFYIKNKFEISSGKDASWKVAHRNLSSFDGNLVHSAEVDMKSKEFIDAAIFLTENLCPLSEKGKNCMRDWEGWEHYFSLFKKIKFSYPLLQNNLRYGQSNGPISISDNCIVN